MSSRLIGEWVEARLYAERVEVWYAQKQLEQLPRLRGRGKHRIDYRHVIDWLVRKPGAFADYRYRADLFPSSRFRLAYDLLREQQPLRAAKEYLGILQLAARQTESGVEAVLERLLDSGRPWTWRRWPRELHKDDRQRSVTDVVVGDRWIWRRMTPYWKARRLNDGDQSAKTEGAAADVPEGAALAGVPVPATRNWHGRPSRSR